MRVAIDSLISTGAIRFMREAENLMARARSALGIAGSIYVDIYDSIVDKVITGLPVDDERCPIIIIRHQTKYANAGFVFYPVSGQIGCERTSYAAFDVFVEDEASETISQFRDKIVKENIVDGDTLTLRMLFGPRYGSDCTFTFVDNKELINFAYSFEDYSSAEGIASGAILFSGAEEFRNVLSDIIDNVKIDAELEEANRRKVDVGRARLKLIK